MKKRTPLFRHSAFVSFVLLLLAATLWFVASFYEWRTGNRLFPWSAYAACGNSQPDELPSTVRIGLYEEFPVPWRLDKLRQVDFPVTLAVAASSLDQFTALKKSILSTYPQVREVVFWPLLTKEEGYYPGAWSKADGVHRVVQESEGLPTLLDLEMPVGQSALSIQDWWRNRTLLDQWLRQRTAPVYIWRSQVLMGLNSLFLKLAAMHFDPADYPTVSLQLDLYTAGEGQPRDKLAQILRCGVEAYGNRFIPSFGVLNDGEGPENIFIPASTLKRNLQLARAAGVSEIWLFGANGLNAEYLAALKETIPLETLPQ
jgi:hypothetical protein